jgi:tetratricopeptide (TPR) repeat protein
VRAAIACLVIVTLLGGARAATPSWDWGSFWYQKRAGSLLGGIRSQLFARHPTLPPHSRLFFANLPNNIGLLAGDGPAIRIWYRDPTLRARWYSEYSTRMPEDSLGADLFFRFDPGHGLTEVRTGPEFDAPEPARSAEWQRNQRVLASLFLHAGNVRGAAGSYAKLWRYFPQQAENALYAATLYDAAGDSSQAARYYQAAVSALGSETVRRAAPTLVAAARDSAQAAGVRSDGR